MPVLGQRPAGWQQRGGNNSSNNSAATSSRQLQASSSAVEVHFQVQYGCQFGQHVSIVGTFQGWQVPQAVPMTWAQGDVWNAVLPVPVGTDLDYKYIVMWDDGNVARWQEGPNNRLSVQHPGVLMHVQDTWSQKERSVREVGPRLTHNQDQKQAGGHSNGATAPKPAPAAAAATAEADGAAAQVASSSRQPPQEQGKQGWPAGAVGAGLPAAAAPLPMQPTWGALQQGFVLDPRFGASAAAAEEDELHLYEDEDEDQHWPADMLQKAAAAAAAAPAEHAPSSSSNSVHGVHRHHHHQQQQVPQASTIAAAIAAAAAGNRSQQQQQQQQEAQHTAAANLAELLPLLRTELESALSELAKHPGAAQQHGHLLSEGQTVLAALQQQQQQPSPPAANVASSSTTTSGVSSSSSRGSSPGRSPSASLTSGDEIAAALLSDDCEEACFCMVDALCSCGDWDLNCSCESDEDTPCALSDSEGEEGGIAVISAAPPAPHQHRAPPAQAPPAPARTPAAVTALHAGAGSNGTGGSSAISIAELARAAAIAARHDPAALAARDVAFADVQAALEKSAQLLLVLSDPTHPLVLEADRNLATASRQLHAGHLLN